jgi:hypothetical protein
MTIQEVAIRLLGFLALTIFMFVCWLIGVIKLWGPREVQTD